MPISKYDRYFGGNAAKALKAMIAEYGEKKGRQIFYATINKKKSMRRRRHARKKAKRGS